MRRSWYLVLNGFFTLMLAVGALGLVYTGAREGWFLLHAARAQGKVVAVETSIQRGTRNVRDYTVYRPTLSFQDADGKAWTFTRDGTGSEGRRVGVVLPVVYDPVNPAHAQIASFSSEWEDTMGFLWVGFAGLVIRAGLRQFGAPAKPNPPRDPAILAGP